MLLDSDSSLLSLVSLIWSGILGRIPKWFQYRMIHNPRPDQGDQTEGQLITHTYADVQSIAGVIFARLVDINAFKTAQLYKGPHREFIFGLSKDSKTVAGRSSYQSGYECDKLKLSQLFCPTEREETETGPELEGIHINMTLCVCRHTHTYAHIYIYGYILVYT